MNQRVYHKITDNKKKGKRCFAVLVDPDKTRVSKSEDLIARCIDAKVDLKCIFLSGSIGGSCI
ncbi:MAG: hypothetical protein EBV23_13755 [Flavobacteriia bacterium]|nr:hypothetical protein [Flavobacteriia bacterium]